MNQSMKEGLILAAALGIALAAAEALTADSLPENSPAFIEDNAETRETDSSVM
jgi:hypothetical protein